MLAGGSAAWAQESVLVVNVNGQTTVTWRGREVYSGPVRGAVRGLTAGTDREEFAAAFTGDTVLWENVPGAAEKVKSAAGAAASFDRRSQTRGRTAPPSARTPPSSGLWVISTNGLTKATWNGRQVYVGPTRGTVTGAARILNGEVHAAVFEDNAVLWENKRGSAKLVK